MKCIDDIFMYIRIKYYLWLYKGIKECPRCGYINERHSPFCKGHEDWKFIQLAMLSDPVNYGHWKVHLVEHENKIGKNKRRVPKK